MLAMIVARPGRRRESLRALLMAAPQVATVAQVNDWPQALRESAGCPPALVVVDIDLSADEVQTLVRQLKARWPQTPSIILTDTIRQQEAAEAAGADAALLKGFSATELFVTMEELLPGE